MRDASGGLIVLDDVSDEIDGGLNALSGAVDSDHTLVGSDAVGVCDGDHGAGLGLDVSDDGTAFADDGAGTDGGDGDLLAGSSPASSTPGSSGLVASAEAHAASTATESALSGLEGQEAGSKASHVGRGGREATAAAEGMAMLGRPGE